MGCLSKMADYPSYHPRDYPVGIDDFLNTFPPERRGEVRAAVLQEHLQGKAEKEWVEQQVRGMFEVPDIIYKYIPYQHLDCGLPTVLRATQPSSQAFRPPTRRGRGLRSRGRVSSQGGCERSGDGRLAGGGRMLRQA